MFFLKRKKKEKVSPEEAAPAKGVRKSDGNQPASHSKKTEKTQPKYKRGRNGYPPEFRRQVVDYYLIWGMNTTVNKYKIARPTVRNWVKAFINSAEIASGQKAEDEPEKAEVKEEPLPSSRSFVVSLDSTRYSDKPADYLEESDVAELKRLTERLEETMGRLHSYIVWNGQSRHHRLIAAENALLRQLLQLFYRYFDNKTQR